MEFEFNRIDGNLALASLRLEDLSIDEVEATIELPVAANHFFELALPVENGHVESKWLDIARDVLGHLTRLDNQIQHKCFEQWKGNKNSLPSSFFEGELTAIRVGITEVVRLRYAVIGCNSEWEERIVRIQGSWQLLS